MMRSTYDTYEECYTVILESSTLFAKEKKFKKGLKSYLDQLYFERGLVSSDKNFSFIISSLDEIIEARMSIDQILMGNNIDIFNNDEGTKYERRDGAMKRDTKNALEYFRKSKLEIQKKYPPLSSSQNLLTTEETRKLFDDQLNQVGRTLSGELIEEREEARA